VVGVPDVRANLHRGDAHGDREGVVVAGVTRRRRATSGLRRRTIWPINREVLGVRRRSDTRVQGEEHPYMLTSAANLTQLLGTREVH
jgi:hypothetical protein